MKRVLLTAVTIVLAFLSAHAQTGEIQGKVTEPDGRPVPFATVLAYLNDVEVELAQTDFNGFYSIKPLSPGSYKISATFFGKTATITGVNVSPGQTTFLDPLIINTAVTTKEVVIEYQAPPIEVGKPDAGDNITREQIEKMPKNNLVGIIGNSGGTYQSDDNSLISIAGSRSYSTKYLIDGVDLTGVVELPTEAIDQIQIVTSGVEAKQGDLTGGIVSISTRGPSRSYHGTVEGVTSQFLDPYGYNQLRFSLLGPLYTKYKGTDTAKSILGFLLTAEGLYRKDVDPPGIPLYQVNGTLLDSIRQNPLRFSSDGSGLNKNTEFIMFDDVSEIKYRPNNDARQVSTFGKLDFKPSRNINITFGSQFYHQKRDAYIRTFALLNPENNPIVENTDARFYLKFTQRFLDRISQDQEENAGYKLGNAYYTIQADYQRNWDRVYDRTHEFDPFQYGYIGQFETFDRPFYALAGDANPITGKRTIELVAYLDTAVHFTPGTVNPDLTRYTEQVFENFDVSSISEVQLLGGIRNGDFVQNMFTYSMWYNPGVPYTSYSKSDNAQVGLRFDASVDFKKSTGDRINKHAIEFGFEYQQRNETSFNVSPFGNIGIWGLARQNTNFHLTLDTDNPYYLIDGDTIYYSDYSGPVGEFDTTFFYYQANSEEQRYFDYALRQKLGLPVDGIERINIDGLDPTIFSLDMFSPDELLNSGNRLVSVRGFDYYGNKLTGNPSFNDFFTKTNIDGDPGSDPAVFYTRDIGAYRPIYNAAYVQDKFNIGRVIFRLGLRIDRFDANQKVLRDKYSLYAVRSAQEVDGALNPGGSHPGTIGDDFAVYVDNIESPNTIIGYREGDTWYDAQGNEVFDPNVLANNTSSGQVTPYLVNSSDDIKDPDVFDPNLSFQDYDPQITIMPRVAFSFPITETAMFTAHYDVLTQRPLGSNEATPYHYYYMEQLATDGILPNPDLKPEKTINYQLGFQQALSDHSALKISAYYKELRDMVQVVAVNYAYPIDYRTYGNVDFGTVKGFTLTYDLIRRVRNVLMTAAYTLQFADGTGSSQTSQASLVAAGQPNLRTILPLSYDVRHTFNVNIDYRFPEGEDYNGPVIGGGDILANAGINLALRARSGEPFTRQSNATPTAQFGVASRSQLEGNPNGSRLPWNFKADVRFDKDLTLRAADPETKKGPLYLNVYLLIQNALNTKNVISVYRYTGSAVDDGYLDAPETASTIEGQVSPESFVDLYTMKMRNPDNYALPRRIQLGVKFKF